MSSDKPKFKVYPSFTVGLCRFIFADDGCWYRAVVCGNPSHDALEVVFVDYGNTSIVALGDIRPYKPSWTQWPVLAVKCRLSGVPGDGTQKVDETVVQVSINKSS